MVRATLNNLQENLQVCDRYFVKRIDATRFDGAVAMPELQQRETEETGRSLGDILAGWQIPRHWFTADDPGLWSLSRTDLRKRFKRC